MRLHAFPSVPATPRLCMRLYVCIFTSLNLHLCVNQRLCDGVFLRLHLLLYAVPVRVCDFASVYMCLSLGICVSLSLPLNASVCSVSVTGPASLYTASVTESPSLRICACVFCVSVSTFTRLHVFASVPTSLSCVYENLSRVSVPASLCLRVCVYVSAFKRLHAFASVPATLRLCLGL